MAGDVDRSQVTLALPLAICAELLDPQVADDIEAQLHHTSRGRQRGGRFRVLVSH